MPNRKTAGYLAEQQITAWGAVIGSLRIPGGGPECVTPDQVYGSRPQAPAQKFLQAMLEHAILELDKKPRIRNRARAWFASEDESWPFSFRNVCYGLGVEPSYMRRRIYDDVFALDENMIDAVLVEEETPLWASPNGVTHAIAV